MDVKRLFLLIVLLSFLAVPAAAEPIRWVDLQVSTEALKLAIKEDIATFDQEKHTPFPRILALAACRTGGKCTASAVKKAAQDLRGDREIEDLLGSLSKYYSYYLQAYTCAYGGLVGSFSIQKDGQELPQYGLKAFSPIAAGYGYSHCDDFGASRSFGFKRKNL